MKIDLWKVILTQIACVAIGYWRGWRNRTWKYELQEQENLRKQIKQEQENLRKQIKYEDE